MNQLVAKYDLLFVKFNNLQLNKQIRSNLKGNLQEWRLNTNKDVNGLNGDEIISNKQS